MKRHLNPTEGGHFQLKFFGGAALARRLIAHSVYSLGNLNFI